MKLIEEDILRSLERHARERPGFMQDLAMDFIRQAEALLPKLRQAGTEGDAPACASLAHRLGGSGAALGAIGLAAACRVLEASAREGRVEATLVDDVARAYDATANALRKRYRL